MSPREPPEPGIRGSDTANAVRRWMMLPRASRKITSIATWPCHRALAASGVVMLAMARSSSIGIRGGRLVLL